MHTPKIVQTQDIFDKIIICTYANIKKFTFRTYGANIITGSWFCELTLTVTNISFLSEL